MHQIETASTKTAMIIAIDFFLFVLCVGVFFCIKSKSKSFSQQTKSNQHEFKPE